MTMRNFMKLISIFYKKDKVMMITLSKAMMTIIIVVTVTTRLRYMI